MGAVLEYERNTHKEKVWEVHHGEKFTALVKCYVQIQGKKDIQVIEKPSTRPATFQECYRFAQKLKQEYGRNLVRLIVWDLDHLRNHYPGWMS